MTAGRPSDYTPAIADTLCERIADGESLRSICTEDGMPNKATVFRWLAVHETFRDQYAHARETQADSLFDEILHIADTPLMGEKTKVSEGKEEIMRGDMIEHRRLQVDARKWMAGKLRPKKYGDKLQHTGADGEGPVEVKTVTDRDRAKATAAVLSGGINRLKAGQS